MKFGSLYAAFKETCYAIECTNRVCTEEFQPCIFPFIINNGIAGVVENGAYSACKSMPGGGSGCAIVVDGNGVYGGKFGNLDKWGLCDDSAGLYGKQIKMKERRCKNPGKYRISQMKQVCIISLPHKAVIFSFGWVLT